MHPRLAMPINLKENMIVEVTIMHNEGRLTLHHFSKCACPTSAQRKTERIERLLEDLRKIIRSLADNYTNNVTQLQRNTCYENLFFCANSIPPKRTTVCIWRTHGHHKCLHSMLSARLPTDDLHRASAHLFLDFQFYNRIIGPRSHGW